MSIDFSLADREDRLAWIFGSSRSGSTWLLRMLAELQQVVSVDDPHLGHHLGVWRPIPLAFAAADEAPDLTTLLELKADKPSYFFSERYRDDWAPALKGLIETRFEAQARDALDGGAVTDPIVIVKEPGSHAADLLLSLFPGSGLIFLLRDGRDVVDSWLDAYSDGSWAIREGAFPLAEQGRLPLIRWQAAVWRYRTEVVQRAYAAHNGPKVLVRYEDLRARPLLWLRRICGFLRIDVEPNRLKQIAELHEFERVPEGQRGERKEIRAAQPGNWRANLSRVEQEAVHEIIGGKLAELGYLPELEVPETVRAPA